LTTFISYSRDNSDFAVRFARDLKAAGFDIWLDQLDIPKGSRWDDEVERALESSSTFMIVLSPESIESQNVKDEVGYALDGGKHILPLLLRPCKIPFRLRRFQFVDFTDKPYDEGLAEIKHLLSNTKELATGTGDEEDFQQPSSKRSTDQGISARTPQGVETAQPVIVRPHRKWDTQVIIALIGLAGTIIAALLGSPWFERWFATGSLPTTVSTAATDNNQIAPLSLTIVTTGPTLTSTEVPYSTLYPLSENLVYDFADNVCKASWSSGAGELPCPGTDGDAKGFLLKLNNPKLENGETNSGPGILTFPQSIENGYIQGLFPPLIVKQGNRFRVTTSCEIGATSCYVAFRLDYRVGNTIQTFWAFREKYEGQPYNADLNLSSLAGQTVKFILYISAWGSPLSDRALWIAPRIISIGCTNRAQFIADVTVPDGTTIPPGAKFKKTWRFKNIGSCSWTKDYALVFSSGVDMNGPQHAKFPLDVTSGQTVDISVDLEAPLTLGHYRGYWIFNDSSGKAFGIGINASRPTWVDITVQ
jgi:TIR domain-containing protein/Ig-like domain-containing protein